MDPRRSVTLCFGVRSFDTEIYQSIFSGVLQGEVATLPWNNTSIPLVLGVEYREDEINSIPNEVAREGLLIAYFKDGGAVGKRDITELFVETELQLLEDVTLAQDLSLNLALRWTEESTYGSDTTYSAKSVYTPFTGITFRGTYGTSFPCAEHARAVPGRNVRLCDHFRPLHGPHRSPGGVAGSE